MSPFYFYVSADLANVWHTFNLIQLIYNIATILFLRLPTKLGFTCCNYTLYSKRQVEDVPNMKSMQSQTVKSDGG